MGKVLLNGSYYDTIVQWNEKPPEESFEFFGIWVFRAFMFAIINCNVHIKS